MAHGVETQQSMARTQSMLRAAMWTRIAQSTTFNVKFHTSAAFGPKNGQFKLLRIFPRNAIIGCGSGL